MNKISKAVILAATAVLAWYLSVAAAGSTNTGVDTVSKQTSVSEKVIYLACGHEEQSKYAVPEGCIGLSPEKAAKQLGGVFLDFVNNELSIEKTDASCCIHHYRIFLEGNYIKTQVIRTGKIKNEYPTSPSQYSENDRRILTDGITVDSEESLASIIEDFTS